MKRRIVGAGVVVLIVALAAIGAWYLMRTRAVMAQEQKALDDFRVRSRPVAVTFTVEAPKDTPRDQVLYLSGSVPALGNWDAAGVPLQRDADGKYHATVSGLLNTMEYAFKITRGTWGSVETDSNGKEIPNHTFTASEDGKVEIAPANWIDKGQSVPGRVTTTGDVRLRKKFHSSLLDNDRTLAVYVPPGYEKDSTRRYPVLYLQDGQNLFDESTSYQGIEWKLDETAQQLIESGKIEPVILVGVYNTPDRTSEFTPPFPDLQGARPTGDLYAKMLAEEVKPFIDKIYRTRADREHTLVGGGSMGGLIALYAAKTHNDVFGQVVALSPWLRIGKQSVVADLVGDGNWLKGTRFYIDMGTDPGHNYPDQPADALSDAQAFVAALKNAGLQQGRQFQYSEIEGGRHNELSWQATAPQMLLSVFGTSSASVPATAPGVAASP